MPDPGRTSLALEYFCSEGDTLWQLPDVELIRLARTELETLGLAEANDVADGMVIRQPKAYPVYDRGIQEHLRIIRNYLSGMENLHTIGRNGLHRYNNQDHSMLSAMTAVENIRNGVKLKENIWQVNTESEYHEEK